MTRGTHLPRPFAHLPHPFSPDVTYLPVPPTQAAHSCPQAAPHLVHRCPHAQHTFPAAWQPLRASKHGRAATATRPVPHFLAQDRHPVLQPLQPLHTQPRQPSKHLAHLSAHTKLSERHAPTSQHLKDRHVRPHASHPLPQRTPSARHVEQLLERAHIAQSIWQFLQPRLQLSKQSCNHVAHPPNRMYDLVHLGICERSRHGPEAQITAHAQHLCPDDWIAVLHALPFKHSQCKHLSMAWQQSSRPHWRSQSWQKPSMHSSPSSGFGKQHCRQQQRQRKILSTCWPIESQQRSK